MGLDTLFVGQHCFSSWVKKGIQVKYLDNLGKKSVMRESYLATVVWGFLFLLNAVALDKIQAHSGQLVSPMCKKINLNWDKNQQGVLGGGGG